MVAREMGQGHGTLSRAAGLVAEAKSDFGNLSGRLEGQVAHLQGTWTGSGGSAFFSLQQAWTDKQRVILNALDDFEASLRSTEKDNVSTDDAQSTHFHRNASRLG